ncbi:Probable beta-D-xylosidase 2 [Striga hermonthica]|uniref:Probable beta-D-xylosidase 2 n=1 Tax=Striga hermonthica TaxID=68872 RepID=A0A9N7RIM3_STRHE|nr:Probable beta-D-xylosidase 2 [Striga hermonthica]
MAYNFSRSRLAPFFHIYILVLNLSLFTRGSQPPPFACDLANPTTKTFGFCNNSIHIRDRVRDLIGRLSLQEKIKLLVNNAAPVERLGIKGYEWWSEALHGISNVGPGVKFNGEIPHATSFPQVITTAATFNVTLWMLIGQAVSTEGRAMYNDGKAGLTYWSPNVNILRDPRWGRGQETPGEDPYVAAKYAASYVRGLQGNPKHGLKVAACCKHFTAYDIDNWKGVDRYHFNANVTKQDLEETYNVPFKACVSEGKVASIMCSYNQVNGKPTCADPDLLMDTIRKKWKLKGYIVSDCDSVDVFYRQQKYTSTPEDAAALAIRSGLDLNCGSFLTNHTEAAVGEGKLSESHVNVALAHLLTVQMRLGMFDGPYQRYGYLGPKHVCTKDHKKLALEAAQQGIVLLKNNNQLLPLSAGRLRSVAVIGPNSNATNTMIGNYAGIPCDYINPLQGISDYVDKNTIIVHEMGCTDVTCTMNEEFDRAEKAARNADVTILFMGLSQAIEREGLDRIGLLLPGRQQELVSRVAGASKTPVILVVMSGGPIDISFAKNNSNIGAILWAGYPGQSGGMAIAAVLFGKINPGGKLPMTWYPQDYVDKVAMSDMNMHPDSKRSYPGRTYRFYNGTIVFPFGYGLTFTNFKRTIAHGPTKISIPLIKSTKAINNTTLSSKAIRVSRVKCDTLSLALEVDVENQGQMDGHDTIMVFASTNGVVKNLVAFEKVHVLKGRKKRIRFKIDACRHLSVVDRLGIRRIPLVEHILHIGENIEHVVTIQNAVEEVKP